MHQLIASPFLDQYLVLRPGSQKAVKLPYQKFAELERRITADEQIPTWLHGLAQRQWGLDLTENNSGAILVRKPSPYGYGRASYELNLGCNFDCEHCYLGMRKFEGLPWSKRERLLHIVRDAGVLWLQLTGGEPTIDRHFPAVYSLAHELGMMIEVLTNGSRLSHPAILDLLTTLLPYRITISVYGATAETYDSLTRRKGSFRMFERGLRAAHEAGLPLKLSLIITKHNSHEVDQMRALADTLGVPSQEYTSMSPTIRGGAETMASQAPEYLNKPRPVFTGCPAGHTFFHVDPHGKACLCKALQGRTRRGH